MLGTFAILPAGPFPVRLVSAGQPHACCLPQLTALDLRLPLHAACPPRGFTAHVLGYTLHAVVEAVAAAGTPGCLDDSLLLILPLMEVRERHASVGCQRRRTLWQRMGGRAC